MKLFVGLGNPGSGYAGHRHNIGFMAVDAIAEVHGFSGAKKAFQGWVQDGRIGAHKIVLLKPATYMNESGRSIRAALDFYKLTPEDVTVFHDELDLLPFKLKVKRGGGTAGRGGRQVVVAVDPLAEDRHEQRAGGDGARVGDHIGKADTYM